MVGLSVFRLSGGAWSTVFYDTKWRANGWYVLSHPPLSFIRRFPRNNPCPSSLIPAPRLVLQNPEHLLLFAAGNQGDPADPTRTCTINSPGLGKNVLTVGATSSGAARRPVTGDDGEPTSDYGGGDSDIDTIAYFSSYGFTTDGRIKPEVVAPGDQVRWRRFFFVARNCNSSGLTSPTRCSCGRDGNACFYERPL